MWRGVEGTRAGWAEAGETGCALRHAQPLCLSLGTQEASRQVPPGALVTVPCSPSCWSGPGSTVGFRAPTDVSTVAAHSKAECSPLIPASSIWGTRTDRSSGPSLSASYSSVPTWHHLDYRRYTAGVLPGWNPTSSLFLFKTVRSSDASSLLFPVHSRIMLSVCVKVPTRSLIRLASCLYSNLWKTFKMFLQSRNLV